MQTSFRTCVPSHQASLTYTFHLENTLACSTALRCRLVRKNYAFITGHGLNAVMPKHSCVRLNFQFLFPFERSTECNFFRLVFRLTFAQLTEPYDLIFEFASNEQLGWSSLSYSVELT